MRAGTYTHGGGSLTTARFAKRVGTEDVNHHYKFVLTPVGTMPITRIVPGTQTTTVFETFQNIPQGDITVDVTYSPDGVASYRNPTDAGKAGAPGGGSRFWAESDTPPDNQDDDDGNIILS